MAMTNMFRLAVVIVNYRTADLSIDCLSSLNEVDVLPPGTRIVVVDGASGDGSSARIEQAILAHGWSERTTLLTLDINRGFGHGNNRGLQSVWEHHGEPEYVLFLNPDTIVRKGALRELVTFMERTPRSGVAGSLLEDFDGTPQACAFSFPSAFGELASEANIGVISRLGRQSRVWADNRNEAVQVDWVSGASMIVRSETLREIGAFDEDYFLYYEEVDLCLRAAKAGWNCYHVPQSHVVHLVGRSTGVTSRNSTPRRRPEYWFASRRHYFLKNHGRYYLILADVAWVLGHLIFRAKNLVKSRQNNSPPYILRDFLRYSLFRGVPN